MINPLDLTGKRILVTGASSGIGRETAVLLSQLGASVTLGGRDQARLEQTLALLEGTGHHIAAFDLDRLDEIPVWVKELTTANGPLNGLVHSAGLHSALPLRMIGSAAIDKLMRVNLHAAVMLTRGFRQKGCRAPGMCSLVFVSSVAGMVGEPVIAAYSASKAALIGVTRSLAVELALETIRVNAVAPGFVQSEMSERLKLNLTPGQFQAIEANHPGGLGTVRDVANGIAFLLADTSRWMTGTSLVIDGGYTAH